MGTKKLVDLQVVETSGVDHPAHLHEGFLVMKAADTQKARAVLAALGNGRNNMAGPAKPTPAAKATESTPGVDAIVAAVEKAVDSKLQPILDSLAEAWQELRKYGESQDDSTPTADAPAAADPAATDVLAGVDPNIAKALPETVRVMLEKQRDDLAKARDDIAKERDARLDAEAIQKAKDTLPNLGLADDVVKAIRRVSDANPELGKQLDALLTATNAQLDGAPLLKELGSGGEATSTGAAAEIETLAKALVADGTVDTIQKARVAVYEAHPDLVAKMREEVSA